MSEELVIRLCAPTLVGIKTGSLFSAEYASEETLQEELRTLNRILIPKGLVTLALRFGKRRALIYLYRPERLRRDLSDKDARALLEEQGYGGLRADACLGRLMEKLRMNEEFPHEIGLFLSYPPKDVRGFIEHQAEGSKAVGCWKVYGDLEKAEKKFRQYKHCTEVYCRLWRRGTTMDRLTVAG